MQEHKWLTVDEAALLCTQMSLNRTKKTIRSWARNDHVKSTKQTTQHGEMWVLDRQELTAKIKAEKEFAEQHKQVQTGADLSEPVQTGSNPSEPVRDGSNDNEQSKQPDFQGKIRSLETKVMELTVDVRWRSQALDQLKKDNERHLETMHGQARYIGHLESDLLRLGGKLDQQFLAAPNVKSAQSEETALTSTSNAHIVEPTRTHPDQSNLSTG